MAVALALVTLAVACGSSSGGVPAPVAPGAGASSPPAAPGPPRGACSAAPDVPCERGAWCELPRVPGGLLDLYPVGTQALLAVTGTQIYQLDGRAFRPLLPEAEATSVSAVWGTDPSEIVAVGQGQIHYLDDRGWRVEDRSFEEELAWVWGRSPRDLHAGGRYPHALHYDGSAWSVDPELPGSSWSMSATDSVLAVAAGSHLHVRTPRGWRRHSIARLDIHDVWVRSADEIYAVGDRGTLLRFHGDEMAILSGGPASGLGAGARPVTGVTGEELLSVTGNERTVIAVGSGGVVVRYRDELEAMHLGDRRWVDVEVMGASFIAGSREGEVYCRDDW